MYGNPGQRTDGTGGKRDRVHGAGERYILAVLQEVSGVPLAALDREKGYLWGTEEKSREGEKRR